MADVISVPANEGISVKNEQDDPEINAMALKMKENFQKNASSLRQAVVQNAVYINRAGRPVLSALSSSVPSILNSTHKETNEKTSKDVSEDVESIKGRFGWTEIGSVNTPYIMRIIDGVSLKFVSVRIAENFVLSKYLQYLHTDIYACTSVKSYIITEAEAKLLNDVNLKHCDQTYGKDLFLAGKDCIVRLEDAVEFYAFLEVCYKKLLCNIEPNRKEKCGFIRINSESVVPYCIKDDKKYVPLFYFEGETENLKHRAVKLENWSLAYLKFCCKVQGIRNELFASDSCIVTSLDDIKNYFPPETNFEEYWPAKVVDTQLLNHKTPPPGAWIRSPPTVANNVPAPPESTIQHTLPAPTSAVPPSSMPINHNSSYQNSWPVTQMVNSYSIPAQPPAIRGYSAASRIQSGASQAQYYNSNPSIQQSNGPMNSVGHAPPPPLVRTNNPSSTSASNPMSYTNVIASLNQPITTLYNNTMANNNVMSQSNQMRQYYNGQRPNNSGQVQQPQQQQQQHQQQQQLIQQQQQLITAPQVQSYGNPTLPVVGSNARTTNTQQRNALRNITTAPASEIIDLSSPPSSPGLQTPPESVRISSVWDLKRIPERPWGQESVSNAAYKILKATLQGKMIHCINAKPYIYSDLMVTIEDLVQTLFPTCTVGRCVDILQKSLKITLFSGNSEQYMVLRDNGRIHSSKEPPLAMLQDITQVFLQLKTLISKQDEQIQLYQMGGPPKRQRTS